MNESLNRITVLLAGLLLGTLFFGGLWVTVKNAGTSKRPALWIFGSFIIRIAMVLIGFYFIGAGNWRNMLIAFAGFMIARFVVMGVTKSKHSNMPKKEGHHET